jgi:hypothetical protein
MGDEPGQQPETEIEVKGSYHHYYGEAHYGDRPDGRPVPDELWRVLLAWDRAAASVVPSPRRAPLRVVVAIAAAALMAALLYGIFG